MTANRLRRVEATFGIGASSQRASGTTNGNPRLWGVATGNEKVLILAAQFNQKKPETTNKHGTILDKNNSLHQRIKAHFTDLPTRTSLLKIKEIRAKLMRLSPVLMLLAGTGLTLLNGQPSQGQANTTTPAPSQAAKPPSPAQLSQQFRDGFLKGCLNGKTPGVSNQTNYCTCLAGAYQSRYDGPTLAAISQLAARSGQSGPALVNVMMAPEAKSCAAKS
jgi:hypothetical protein